MNISPLMLGLAALVVVIAFGPKRLPSFKRNSSDSLIDLTAIVPSQPAAGRAPSPLAQSMGQSTAPAMAPSTSAMGTMPPLAQQHAMSGAAELQPLQSPQPLRLPDNL